MQQSDAQPKESFAILDDLFRKAKATDEFEFGCALLRIRGGQDAGSDSLQETLSFVRDMVALLNAPLRDETQLRLGLLIYCHIVEADEVYMIIENMLRITEGKRCSIDPFDDLARKKGKWPFQKVIPASAKTVISRVCQHARSRNMEAVAGLLESVFDDEVRNAFFHSDYILFRGEFRCVHSSAKALTFQALIEMVNRATEFFGSFMNVHSTHIRSYESPKRLRGRLGHNDEYLSVELMADEKRGLYGFRTLQEDALAHDKETK